MSCYAPPHGNAGAEPRRENAFAPAAVRTVSVKTPSRSLSNATLSDASSL